MSQIANRRDALCLALVVALGVGLCSADPAPRVPDEAEIVAALFTPDEVARGNALGQRRAVCFAIGELCALVALGLLVGPGLAATERLRERFGAGSRLALAAEATAVGAVLALAELPVRYYAGFVVEHELGLSTQSLGGWLKDLALGHAIVWVLLIGGVLLVDAAQRRWPARWWVAGWAGLTAGIVVFFALQPLVIAPLFNDFRPLPAGPLRDGVQRIARDAGIPVSEVHVIDASRRTKRYNAYFHGVGATRTIALHDTLVDGVPPAQALAVVGHEAGHWTCDHLAKGMTIASVLLLLGLWLLARPGVCGAWPLSRPGGLARMLLVASVLQLVWLPVENTLSRAMEAEADRTGITYSRDPDAMVAMFTALARSNVSNLTPHPLVRACLYTHPPIPERIQATIAWSWAGPPPRATWPPPRAAPSGPGR